MNAAEHDERWREDGQKCGWTLPPKAHWLLRLPVIRRFRAVWLGFKVERHYGLWQSMGMVQTGYDEWVLYAICRGWC